MKTTRIEKRKVISSIETPRLVLRTFSLQDAKVFFEAEQASIKDLSYNWSWARPDNTIDDIKAFIQKAIEDQNKETPEEIFFPIFLKKDKHFLGLIWLHKINWFVPFFEIGYWLDSRETDHGYMTEAVNALSRACFAAFGAKRIQIKVFATNLKSQAIPERLGFGFEAELRNYFINFDTQEIINGLLYACCEVDSLPPLEIQFTVE